MRKLEDHERRLSTLEETIKSGSIRTKQQMPIRELFQKKGPKGDMQMTLLAGYYLESTGLPSFNVKDLAAAFRDAREQFPSNINREISKCIEHGYFMEAEEKREGLKAWNVTREGEDFAENNLGKN